MNDHLSQLATEKYLHLKKVIGDDDCKMLADVMNEIVQRGYSKKDTQCPKSDAIHGAIIFDRLLVDLLPYFEMASGKKLFPTYSYARLYVPEEELLVHIDRPACEISASITLGFEGDVWPIYMGDDMAKSNAAKVEMEIGDAVLYKGLEKFHWREIYTEGKWQAQVFLHYVDADGPFRDWKFDRRAGLNIPTE
jgi:hypothetical protein